MRHYIYTYYTIMLACCVLWAHTFSPTSNEGCQGQTGSRGYCMQLAHLTPASSRAKCQSTVQ
ncbi:hypothetical protein PR003_g15317 [Phytophthora rubi]|uniref:Uncharacterized protein n=2 Tax=Phytophthora TaxID=4783 RepID=A0A6A4EYU9_9STRA|nr:hypothetical protein PR001_g15138 [Phytophthora rubi]KAE9039412.1 hypothetical protein PR002_g5514 [Phytophthora rubi]KAE9329518.1 hypothetical protein PF008_g15923 [Phytophthora fragariae]KAE9330397.1 hypothetical protein PR003_g15317 [Phytophthora rubi]